MNPRILFRFAVLIGLLCLFLAVGVVSAWAFAEEDIGFVDVDGVEYPPVRDFPDDRISTVHDDLTFALSLAAGFTVTDSHTLRIWNQLVDAEVLTGTRGYAYSNAGFYEPPDPDTDCPVGTHHDNQIWPTGRFDSASSGVTSRFGPYSPFFHYPHLGGGDLQALHDWGWGVTTTLTGYEAFAWGRMLDPTVMQAVKNQGCIITRTTTLSMPVQAGTLPAFATYLHSLADAHSHRQCLAALAKENPPAPWGTHTVTSSIAFLGDDSVPACDYNPTKPTNTDAHGREFGNGSDTQQLIDAALAVYAELSARSMAREGVYRPLPLTATLTISGSQITLEQAIIHFITAKNYDEPRYRRDYATALVAALNTVPREAITRVYLPVIVKLT